MKLYCPICGKKMTLYMDTPLCADCDWEVIRNLRFDRDRKLGRLNKRYVK